LTDVQSLDARMPHVIEDCIGALINQPLGKFKLNMSIGQTRAAWRARLGMVTPCVSAKAWPPARRTWLTTTNGNEIGIAPEHLTGSPTTSHPTGNLQSHWILVRG
jgi:hypothetical protein